jgi:hypothetical protein
MDEIERIKEENERWRGGKEPILGKGEEEKRQREKRKGGKRGKRKDS